MIATMLEANLPKVVEHISLLTDKFDFLNDKMVKSVKAEIEERKKLILEVLSTMS